MTSSFARADLLVRPGLEPLWDELARRYGQGAEPVTLSLRDLSLPQRRALADLLGSDRLPGPEFRISVRRLADALAVYGSNDLREVVEQLRGRSSTGGRCAPPVVWNGSACGRGWPRRQLP